MGTLAFLPRPLSGLGISANFTWLGGKMEVLDNNNLITFNSRYRQPDYITNISMFYSVKKFEARISYNKTGSAIRDLRRTQESYSQLDASIKYQVTNNWHVKLSGRNLTSNPRRDYDDGENFAYDFLYSHTDIDASYHLRMIYKY